jgi:hypothetical protein
MTAERSIIRIPTIVLHWSPWHTWHELSLDARGGGGVRIPNKQRGVYEVRPSLGGKERLTIGRAANLRMRIRQGLVKGLTPHSSGTRLRSAISDPSKLEVRWALTDRPAAAEEELHQRYVKAFGRLPEFTLRT